MSIDIQHDSFLSDIHPKYSHPCEFLQLTQLKDSIKFASGNDLQNLNDRISKLEITLRDLIANRDSAKTDRLSTGEVSTI
jgi:hypothetical protein